MSLSDYQLGDLRIGSLFSGAGGLDMAVQSVFGGEVVWHSEIDKAASKVLAYRFPAPNLGSITEIDWAAVEPVDVLCGGFPCQDVSAAGKRAGIKDGTRSGLWAIFADAIDALRPQYVVIENVRGLLSSAAHRTVEEDEHPLEPSEAVVGDGAGRPVLRALGAVLGDLSDLGYDAVWATVAASAVGAPHRRERVFIVGTLSHTGHDAGCAEHGIEHEKQTRWVGQSSGRASGGRHAAHSSRNGWDEGRPESAGLVGRSDAAVSGDEPGRVELLPTPCVVDRLATGEMTLEEWDESRRSQKERGVGSFGPRGDSLGAAILRVEEGTERPDYSTTKARRRGGDEPGVALLPTPCAQQSGNSPEEHLRKKPGRKVVTDLAILVENGLLESGGALLPTPAAGNFNDGEEAEQWLACQAAVKERLNNGNGMGMPLAIAVQLLPTPNASDSLGGGSHPDRRVNADGLKHGRSIRDYALLHNTDQWGKYAPAIRRWEQIVGPAPAPTEPNKNGNPRLNSAFSEWLMGWPAGWVTDPAIGISRNDQLRIVGNGVCTQQAIAALTYLLAVTA